MGKKHQALEGRKKSASRCPARFRGYPGSTSQKMSPSPRCEAMGRGIKGEVQSNSSFILAKPRALGQESKQPHTRHTLADKLFSFMNASTELKTLRNSGVPANESGLTGPMVMKLYWRDETSNELCGSRKSR